MTTYFRHAAIADGTSPDVTLDQTVVISNGRIAWLGHDDAAPAPEPDATMIDAGGTTIVPGMVDAHSHTTLQGGSHWIERIGDDTAELLEVAEHNGLIARRAGVSWFRDVGSPRRDNRALALTVRDSWHGRHDVPYLRAAGTWISKAGVLPPGIDIEAEDADALVAAVIQQIEEGADLVKLYLDGPDRDVAPWTADEVARATAAAHERSVTVTAHATNLHGATAAVHGNVDCVEHGHHLDAALAQEMAARGTFLVPTLGVFASWETFGATTSISRFTGADDRKAMEERREIAYGSVRLAEKAGVKIAAGTDFGGGSLRANHLAWEVECLVAAGLTPAQGLAAATWIGGELLGEDHAGRLVAGGPADFFMVHGNPLDDPSALWRVWRTS